MGAAQGGLSEPLGWRQGLAVVLVIVLGVGLRLRGLDEGTLFIDEAESSLNALTILERGAPVGQYLGMPLFENTLTEPWPESTEFEFRDSSYSDEGLAIYHGWLPLYAIACSQALHGIRPDEPSDPPRVQHDEAEIRGRIHAARLPSVAFGALFLLAMFLAGRALYGTDAGMAALLAAALAPKCIWLAQQARYYSAGLALTALFLACAVQARRRGAWSDFVSAAVVAVLLFHTHSLAFALAALASAALLPGALRHAGSGRKLAVALGIVLTGLVPWMLRTGYFEHAGRIPMARELLRWSDYFVYVRERSLGVGVGSGAFLGFLVLWGLRARLPERVSRPLTEAGMPVLFLTLTVLVNYFGFQLLAPAASCSMARLSHLLVIGPTLLGAIGVAMLTRWAWGRRTAPACVALTLALLLVQGGVFHRQERNPAEAEAVFQVVERLRGLELGPASRIYSLPYQHFALTYYTGLPVQSIAPVRREFLASYPGEIWVLETAGRAPRPSGETVRRAAARAGVDLSLADADAWAPELQRELIRAQVAPHARALRPPRSALPPWGEAVLAHLPAEIEAVGQGVSDYARDNPAMFAGLPPLTYAQFWPFFFYRFVDPSARSGERLNYLCPDVRRADVELLPSLWTVWHFTPLERELTAQ